MALTYYGECSDPEAGEIAGINQLTLFHLNTFLPYPCDPAVDRRPGSWEPKPNHKEANHMKTKKCPRCGKLYSGPSALSRSDNTTEICPACGMAEALKAMDAVKADAARDQGDPVDDSLEANSWYLKIENLVKSNGPDMMPEVGKLYCEAVKDFTLKMNRAATDPAMHRGDLIFFYDALCIMKQATERQLNDSDRGLLDLLRSAFKFKVATISKDGGKLPDNTEELFYSGQLQELKDQGAEINVSGYESSDSPDPLADASIGGKNNTKTVIDLSCGSKAEKIDKLCGLINMILKTADPVVKHGTLIAVQTMLFEKHEDSIEPVLQEFTDTMNQYFDEYRSYLTDEQRKCILSAFE